MRKDYSPKTRKQNKKDWQRKKAAKSGAILYGKNSILERVRTNPSSIKKVYYRDTFKEKGLLNRLEGKGIPLEEVTESKLMRLKRADRLQGIVAEVETFQYTEIEELVADALEEKRTILCLDSISDPHNFGALLRICACFGGFSVAIPRYSACEVNDTVMHVASGGENYVPVCMVNNLMTVLEVAKQNDFTIAGTIVEQGEDLNNVALPFPLCLVLGSEGKGIRHGLKKYCDLSLRIPMRGANLSFNVAIAGAIFCHEINKQRESSL